MMPVLFAENAPDWMCLTSLRYKHTEHSTIRYESDPVRAEGAEAKRQAEHEAAEIRKAERREETALARILRREVEERLRAELSESRRIARATDKAPKPPRQIVARHRGQQNHIAPEGMLSLAAAAKAAPCSQQTLTVAIKRGDVPVLRKGRYVFMRLDDVKACVDRIREHGRKYRQENIGRVRASRAIRENAEKAEA